MLFRLSIIKNHIMRSKWTEAIIHFVVWLALLSFPILINLENNHLSLSFLSHVWIMLLGLMITFYANYIWGVDKLLYKKRYVYFVLFNILVFVIVYKFNDIANDWVNELQGFPSSRHRPRPHGMIGMSIYNNLIFFLLGVGASLGLRYSHHLSESEMERKRLETEKLTSEISMLKYQMQPHFFFNTLNNIYSLISKSPADAQKAVHRLSKMMRYILYENVSSTIELSKEIEFLNNYSSLMNLRMNDKVKINIDVPEDTIGIEIPPLLLIPLLENAFKHGIVPNGESFIDCILTIDNNIVNFEVRNSTTEEEVEDRSHSGIGLSNLQKRMKLLYGNNFTFSATKEKNDIFVARLSFPLLETNKKD